MLTNKSILITGGTSYFGNNLSTTFSLIKVTNIEPRFAKELTDIALSKLYKKKNH